MGQPVVHFEVIGKDGEKLRGYYSELFGWKIDADNPMGYGIVERRGQPDRRRRVGIGGGIAGGPDGYEGHVTFYVAVPDVEAALAKAESSAALASWVPETVMGTIELGQFTDPEGHMIGLVKDQM